MVVLALGSERWDVEDKWVRCGQNEPVQLSPEKFSQDTVNLFVYLTRIDRSIGRGFLRPLSPLEIRDILDFLNDYISEGFSQEIRACIINNVEEYMNMEKVGALEERCGAVMWSEDAIARMAGMVQKDDNLHAISKKTLSRITKFLAS